MAVSSRALRLGERAAGALAELIDAEPAASLGQATCVLDGARRQGALSSTAVIEFAYPAGHAPSEVPLLVPGLGAAATGCTAVVGFVDGMTRQLDDPLGQLVEAWAFEAGRGYVGSPSTPDLVGQPLADAARTAARYGDSLVFAGEEVDAGAPAAAVLLQGPPAGWGDQFHQISVMVNEHPAPPCAPSELVADYLGGEGSTQQLFGWFVLRDVASKACSLSGPFEFAGVDRAGRVVTTALHPQLSPTGMVLTPRARLTPQGRNAPIGEIEAALTVAGPECSMLDPANAKHLPWVKPARWVFRFPSGSVFAPNALPPGYTSLSAATDTGFGSCQGAIYLASLSA